MKRWPVGLVLCLLLVASKASATYLVIENISQTAPAWGSCGCISPTGWLGFITFGVTVVDSDGTPHELTVWSSDYWPRWQTAQDTSYFVLLDAVTKTNPVGPGEKHTSKKIIALPDTGFSFRSQGANFGIHYCAECLDSCGGYSSGLNDIWPASSRFILPGVPGSDTVDFQIPLADNTNASVIRVTFYPGNPPPRGKSKQ